MHALLPVTFPPAWSNFLVFFFVVKYLLSWELLFLWLILLTCVWTDQTWARTEFQSILHRQHIFLVCCNCLYQSKHTEDTYKIWIQRTTHCKANLVSLAYTAFYLPVKPLKSNSFTDFKPSSLHSPAGRLKLDYRIISNVIPIATYSTLVPFVWKSDEVFGFGYLGFAFFFLESRVKHCYLPRLKLMKNVRFRTPWKICCEKKKADFFSPIL